MLGEIKTSHRPEGENLPDQRQETSSLICRHTGSSSGSLQKVKRPSEPDRVKHADLVFRVSLSTQIVRRFPVRSTEPAVVLLVQRNIPQDLEATPEPACSVELDDAEFQQSLNL